MAGSMKGAMGMKGSMGMKGGPSGPMAQGAGMKGMSKGMAWGGASMGKGY